ncbi:MAG: hypothetical protein SFX74_10540 [Fimbriimonadaceae bacterium]|nr:hypothetical protein [Fimbriimonadaceae bacterium]
MEITMIRHLLAIAFVVVVGVVATVAVASNEEPPQVCEPELP